MFKIYISRTEVWALGHASDQILYGGTQCMWVFIMESVSLHPSGTCNFEVSPTLLEILKWYVEDANL